jgi:hypothetical protein
MSDTITLPRATVQQALEAELPRTYVNDAGEEKRDRRRKDRDNDDPRIAHLFNGFDNMIQNADDYSAGYLRAMRQEFGQLIAALEKPEQATVKESLPTGEPPKFEAVPYPEVQPYPFEMPPLTPEQSARVDAGLRALKLAVTEVEQPEQEPGSVCARCGGWVCDPVIPQPQQPDHSVDANKMVQHIPAEESDAEFQQQVEDTMCKHLVIQPPQPEPPASPTPPPGAHP